jgi:hypothetical protein
MRFPRVPLQVLTVTMTAPFLVACVEPAPNVERSANDFWPLVIAARDDPDRAGFENISQDEATKRRLAQSTRRLILSKFPIAPDALLKFLLDNRFLCYGKKTNETYCFYQNKMLDTAGSQGFRCDWYDQAWFIVGFDRRENPIEEPAVESNYERDGYGPDAECLASTPPAIRKHR